MLVRVDGLGRAYGRAASRSWALRGLSLELRRGELVAIGGRVEMTFRRLFTADGIHNYFWKGKVLRG